ncbi:hypothetical protein Huta_0263 [Halorhabdus utahensis DSM 12940]|uniref:Uncharacterized protein n=1 Tax=Halorhabdus utahensis (strain DSM 12940 / JCM 11049 / AX-2) TaxID=519442 RepID=C7NQJ2_HALUD|nr:hypothetical protein [Halorhabdus utahensis]ACV10451.1 hypothetical protein Huta_0263 [Halorhabdus utahensis DSM 12940]
MIGLGSQAQILGAATLVGAVLIEAVVLYIGYGALSSVVAEPLVERIRTR